jgi:hypothetical protein
VRISRQQAGWRIIEDALRDFGAFFSLLEVSPHIFLSLSKKSRTSKESIW